MVPTGSTPLTTFSVAIGRVIDIFSRFVVPANLVGNVMLAADVFNDKTEVPVSTVVVEPEHVPAPL
jgi:hypothetical protein